MSSFFHAVWYGLWVGKNQRNRRQERTDWKHGDFKMVDELELLIENPIEIKSEKNRRQADSDHRHGEIEKLTSVC